MGRLQSCSSIVESGCWGGKRWKCVRQRGVLDLDTQYSPQVPPTVTRYHPETNLPPKPTMKRVHLLKLNKWLSSAHGDIVRLCKDRGVSACLVEMEKHRLHKGYEGRCVLGQDPDWGLETKVPGGLSPHPLRVSREQCWERGQDGAKTLDVLE